MAAAIPTMATRATPTPIPALAPEDNPLDAAAGGVGELVADCVLDGLVVVLEDVLEAVVVFDDVRDEEETVEDEEETAAATLKVSENASAPVES